MGRLVQISVSDGGVPKTSTDLGTIETSGIVGDRQASPEIHGGPERAVCLWSLEVIQQLQSEGHPIDAGCAGENFTVSGIDWTALEPGSRLQVGKEVILHVTSYAGPCKKNARWFSDGDFGRISVKRNPGFSRVYARVEQRGEVRPGDPVEIL